MYHETLKKKPQARSASPPTADGARRYRIQAIDRAVQILNCFAEGEGELTVQAIAERTGLHKSTAHRILMALHHNGFIGQDASGSYHLGLHLFNLGHLAVSRLSLQDVARPILKDLMKAARETAITGILDSDQVVLLDAIDGPGALFMPTRIGASSPAYCTSLGKALLAGMTEQDVRRIMGARAFRRRTPKTIRDVDSLLEELEVVRQRGYAFANQELEPGLSGVGAAILDHSGAAVAAIAVAGPSTRLRPSAALGKLVRDHAARISAGMGFRPAPSGP